MQKILGSSRVRMGVNPRGILEGVAVRPTGRARLQETAVRAGNASGIPGSGKRAGLWKSFLRRSLPGRPSSGFLFTDPQGNGGGEAPPTPLAPFLLESKKLEGVEEGCGDSSSSPTPEEDRQMDGLRAEWGSAAAAVGGGGRGSRRGQGQVTLLSLGDRNVLSRPGPGGSGPGWKGGGEGSSGRPLFSL